MCLETLSCTFVLKIKDELHHPKCVGTFKKRNPGFHQTTVFKMAAEVAEELELPEEVTESLETFHEALGKVEDVLKPLLETSVDNLREKVRK